MSKVIIGSARSDEKGGAMGGKAGNQNGRELSTQEWYAHKKGWRVLRAKDPEKAKMIADCMEAACKNKHIGYDQGQNQTLWNEAKKFGFDVSKVTKDVETDCARLVRVCCAFAGIIGKDFYTATQASALMATGEFNQSTASKYCTSPDYLRRGDILVTLSQGHTVVVLTDGDKAGKPAGVLLCNGDEGTKVKTLQKDLISLGYSCGKWGADGEFGPATESALTAFQYDHGLPETGWATQADLDAIAKAKNPDDEDEIPPDTTDEGEGGDAPEPGADAFVVITGNTVYVRDSPNTTGRILGVAYLNDSYKYVGEVSANGWHKIEFSGDVGWVSGLYSVLSDKIPEPPAEPEPEPTGLIVDFDQHSNLQDKKMDWETILSKCDFVILRCGVTRTETKPLGIGKDDDFAYVAKICIKYGKPFWVYYYGKVKTAAEARDEAKMAYKIASPYNPIGYFYDIEEGRLTNAGIKAFAAQLRVLGVKKVGRYIGHNYYEKYKDTTDDYDTDWIPRYGKNDGKYDPKYKPAFPCDIHQYTSVGKVKGCTDSTMDLNRLTGRKPLSWFTTP